jgi:hypothetical protein
MRKLKLSAAVAVLAVPLLLSGCSGDSYGIAALESPAGPSDVIPQSGNLPFPVEIDGKTLRLLVEEGGRQYFGAQSADGSQACVAVLPMDQDLGAYAGCGEAAASTENRIITVGGPDGKSTTLVRGNAYTQRLESESLRQIHKNV